MWIQRQPNSSTIATHVKPEAGNAEEAMGVVLTDAFDRGGIVICPESRQFQIQTVSDRTSPKTEVKFCSPYG
ncbi:MAG: hypothetical protein LH631_07460 [Alkalinema sp. CAN_BIN05]|nr:hypothetical protein [Alkalinema sp. CAN_BIN05]